MCRSIKPLRRADSDTTTGEIEAAALQFVRKVSDYRTPSTRNQDAFDAAVAEIAEPPRGGCSRRSASRSSTGRIAG